MSVTVEAGEKSVTKEEKLTTNSPWSLWTRQTLAIMRLELMKNFLTSRAILLYLLAGLPLALLAVLAIFPPPSHEFQNFGELSLVYAVVYGGLILRTLVFFGCAWLFMNLFRGEVVDEVCTTIFSRPCAAKSSSSGNIWRDS